MGQLILITSGKGGSGKTTLAVNLAQVYAAEGLKTLVLDLNQALRNADIYMGLESEVIFDLGDVLGGVCRLEKAMAQDSRFENLYLLCCPQYKSIDGGSRKKLPDLYARLRAMFDVVVIDSPAGAGDLFELAADGVDSAVIVLTPDHQSLRNGDTVDQKLAEIGVSDRHFVVNRVVPELWNSNAVPGLEQMINTMNCNLVGVLSEDIDIHIGNNTGVPAASDRSSYIYSVFRNIAASVRG